MDNHHVITRRTVLNIALCVFGLGFAAGAAFVMQAPARMADVVAGTVLMAVLVAAVFRMADVRN